MSRLKKTVKFSREDLLKYLNKDSAPRTMRLDKAESLKVFSSWGTPKMEGFFTIDLHFENGSAQSLYQQTGSRVDIERDDAIAKDYLAYINSWRKENGLNPIKLITTKKA